MGTEGQGEQLSQHRGTLPPVEGYTILECLGNGRTGEVYKAYQKRMDRYVAIKFLLRELTSDQTTVVRFLREAKAVARLNHPGIVQGIDCGNAAGQYYLVMEFADGLELDRIIEQEGSLSEKRALNVAIQTADALEHAQNNGIVHRDLKPSHMVMTKNGQIKITDFGIAGLLYESVSERPADVDPGDFLGTPAYMAPEQIKGTLEPDIRCDLYSIGIILFHMLTGSVPFSGTISEVVRKQLEEPVPDPRVLNPHISDTTVEIIQRLTSKDPDERFQAPHDLVLELTMANNELSWPSSDEIKLGKQFSKMLEAHRIEVGLAEESEQREETEDEGPAGFAGAESPPPVPARPDPDTSDIQLVDLDIFGKVEEPDLIQAGVIPPGMKVRLVAIEGKGQGLKCPLPEGARVTIGRDSKLCRIALLDPQISRIHCTVSFENGRVYLEDAGSSNGTYVGGKRIKSCMLRPGTVFKLGSNAFKLEALKG